MTDNVCFRCGKERVLGKEKKLILNNVETLRTTYVCPDKACQKIVDEELKVKMERKLALQTLRNTPRINRGAKAKTADTPTEAEIAKELEEPK